MREIGRGALTALVYRSGHCRTIPPGVTTNAILLIYFLVKKKDSVLWLCVSACVRGHAQMCVCVLCVYKVGDYIIILHQGKISKRLHKFYR